MSEDHSFFKGLARLAYSFVMLASECPKDENLSENIIECSIMNYFDEAAEHSGRDEVLKTITDEMEKYYLAQLKKEVSGEK